MPRVLSLLLVIAVGACSDDTKPVADSRLGDLQPRVDGPRADSKPVTDGRHVADSKPAADGRPPDVKHADQKLSADKLPDGVPAKKDGWGITCGATIGSGIVSGTVQGKAISTTTAGGVRFLAYGFPVAYSIAFFNQSGTCTAVSQAVSAPVVMIALCAYAPGTYTIGKNCFGDGLGISVVNGVSLPGTPTIKATSGTITIDSFDPACGGKVKGSFSASFSGDTLTGTFDTVSCGDLTVS